MNVVLPLVVALLSGVGLIILGKAPRFRRWAALTGMAVYFASGIALLRDIVVGGPQWVSMGGWKPPLGIEFHADVFSAMLVAMAGLVGLMTTCYGLGSSDSRRDEIGHHPVTFFLMAGVTGAFLTGDLFNLYVWFELILLASFILISLGDEKRHLRAAIHYVILNLVGSALFLAGLGLLYGATGTLNMGQLGQVLYSEVNLPTAVTIGTLITIAFCVKAAVFPFSAWLPASYPSAPTAVAALFAGLLTKVGVYCLYRTSTHTFDSLPDFHFETLAFLAIVTSVIGALAATVQNDIRRIFAFLLVSHVGLMVLGLSVSIRDGIAYTWQHMPVICALYLMLGLITRGGGSAKLSELGGFGRAYPWLGTLFIVAGFSLSGVPPLSGFWPKLGMMQGAVTSAEYYALATIVFVGILTLIAVARVWRAVFWRPSPVEGKPSDIERPIRMLSMVAPIVILVGLSVAIGLFPSPFYRLATRADEELKTTTMTFDVVEAR